MSKIYVQYLTIYSNESLEKVGSKNYQNTKLTLNKLTKTFKKYLPKGRNVASSGQCKCCSNSFLVRALLDYRDY